MENKVERAPGIQLHNVQLVGLDFKYFGEKDVVSKGLLIKMNLVNNINEEKGTLESLLTFEVQTDENLEQSIFTISATVRGLFQEVPGGPLNLKKFSELNGPAILFPFIREAISSTTAKSPLGSVLLPAFNMGALIRGEIQKVEPANPN